MRIKIFAVVLLLGFFGLMQVPESLSEELPDTYSVGQIEWFAFGIQSQIPVYRIQVTDNDMNLDSNTIDKFKIRIWSDSDPVGIMITLYETESDSGIFDSLVYFSEDISTGQRLRTYDGDEATAKYDDHTLPSSYTGTTLEILDTLTIYYPITNPLERQNEFIRIEDDTFNRQSLQTGETITESGALTSLIIGSLGPIIIVFFVVLYALKKIRAKRNIKKKKK